MHRQEELRGDVASIEASGCPFPSPVCVSKTKGWAYALAFQARRVGTPPKGPGPHSSLSNNVAASKKLSVIF